MLQPFILIWQYICMSYEFYHEIICTFDGCYYDVKRGCLLFIVETQFDHQSQIYQLTFRCTMNTICNFFTFFCWFYFTYQKQYMIKLTIVIISIFITIAAWCKPYLIWSLLDRIIYHRINLILVHVVLSLFFNSDFH